LFYDYKRLAGLRTITGGAGADVLTGGVGDDVFVYTAEGDLFTAGVPGALVDVINGTAGTNTIQLNVTDAYEIVGTDVWTGSSNIQVLSQGLTSSNNISITLDATAFTAGIRAVTLAGDANTSGTNTINTSSAIAGENLILIGSAGIDSITGGAGDDIIIGGGFADTINGGAGINVITDAGDGADTINHTSVGSSVAIAVTGTSTVTLAATQLGATATVAAGGNRTVNASTSDATGAVVIDGTALNSSNAGLYTGGSGNDTITGGSGNDTITGGAGADAINVGTGTDTVVQGLADSELGVINTFPQGVIADGDVITFATGLDIITGFTAGGVAGDKLGNVNGNNLAVTLIAERENALTVDTTYFASGVYDAILGTFTIDANGDGVDTLIVQAGAALSAGLDINANASMILLLGVDSDDLVAGNFIA
jgi:Ca2+-binding RTX toxin-like protein